jgi:hypothetical protein
MAIVYFLVAIGVWLYDLSTRKEGDGLDAMHYLVLALFWPMRLLLFIFLLLTGQSGK